MPKPLTHRKNVKKPERQLDLLAAAMRAEWEGDYPTVAAIARRLNLSGAANLWRVYMLELVERGLMLHERVAHTARKHTVRGYVDLWFADLGGIARQPDVQAAVDKRLRKWNLSFDFIRERITHDKASYD